MKIHKRVQDILFRRQSIFSRQPTLPDSLNPESTGLFQRIGYKPYPLEIAGR
ncbi:hypothetical protein [Spirosoma liriopis]|uniref:hypothetical protein n=1 Tax=Spirosoma liriopis TaxID=2937440 RepID=UPI0020C17383|nr:hypothetical protein [Spirosoma liriopis]